MNTTEVKTRIYVQSRGSSSKHDYQWRSIRDSQCQDAPYRNIHGLKQSQLNSFSLVLSRSAEGLFLLISGLDSGRKDIRHRQIRNTVLWSIPNSTDRDEFIYRHIASLALRDRSNLECYIQQAIVANKDNDYGYSVNSDLLEPKIIIQDLIGRDYLDSLNHSEERGIIPDALRSRNFAEIAEDLKKYRLPTSTKNLIIINDGKTQDTVDEGKLYLSWGDILTETPLADERNNAEFGDVNSFSFAQLIRLAPRLALSIMSLIIVISGIQLANIAKNKNSAPALQVKNLQIHVSFNDNKPSEFRYVWDGNYEQISNAPAIETVKLIDSQQQSIATGKVNTNDRDWQINYSSRSQIDCKQQLSIQGFDREEKHVGKSIEIPSICSGVR